MNTIATILVSSGGTALLTTLIAALASNTVNRASAAKLLSEAAKATGEENAKLHEEIRLLRQAVIHLTDAVDVVIPLLETEHRAHLTQMNTAAKLAV